jgi:hypothetical protein
MSRELSKVFADTLTARHRGLIKEPLVIPVTWKRLGKTQCVPFLILNAFVLEEEITRRPRVTEMKKLGLHCAQWCFTSSLKTLFGHTCGQRFTWHPGRNKFTLDGHYCLCQNGYVLCQNGYVSIDAEFSVRTFAISVATAIAMETSLVNDVLSCIIEYQA